MNADNLEFMYCYCEKIQLLLYLQKALVPNDFRYVIFKQYFAITLCIILHFSYDLEYIDLGPFVSNFNNNKIIDRTKQGPYWLDFYQVRPFVGEEMHSNVEPCLFCVPKEPVIIIGNDRHFTFDHVFNPESTQVSIRIYQFFK